jgi:hypothetical protein
MRSAVTRAREDVAAGSRGEAVEPVIQSSSRLPVGTAGAAAPQILSGRLWRAQLLSALGL